MTRRNIIIGAAIGSAVLGFAALVGVAGLYAILKDDDDDDDDDGRDAVARGSRFAKISLQQGLIASEKEGQPISGKFEVDRGKFQLSIYTAKEGKFSEVLVDYSTGLLTTAACGGLRSTPDCRTRRTRSQRSNRSRRART